MKIEKIIEELKTELVGKDYTFTEIENIINDISNRLNYDISDYDSIFNNNISSAFENSSHSYEISEGSWINIIFKVDIEEEDFNIHNDKVIVVDIEKL